MRLKCWIYSSGRRRGSVLGSYWKIINIKLISSAPSSPLTEVTTVVCNTGELQFPVWFFCSLSLSSQSELVGPASWYHELCCALLQLPSLEKRLEEMTQVLKLQRVPSVAPPSTPGQHLSFTDIFPFYSSCLLLPHIFFCSVFTFPHFSHFVSSFVSSFASFSPSIPLPLWVTSASSLPGDLQWRKEASPFPLLLNTCSCYNCCETLRWLSHYALLSAVKTAGANKPRWKPLMINVL